MYRNIIVSLNKEEFEKVRKRAQEAHISVTGFVRIAIKMQLGGKR